MEGIESFGQYLVKCNQCCRIVSFQECIDKRETVLIIKHIQVAEHILILHIGTAERNRLVEDRKGITHRSVSLVSDHMKRLIVNGHTLAGSHHTEVLHDIVDSDPVEIISLTTRQDGRKDLMFLSRSQDEDRMCRRFLESLEEGVESGLREHMDLIDDVYAVLSYLRRYAHLVHECLDVLDSVV